MDLGASWTASRPVRNSACSVMRRGGASRPSSSREGCHGRGSGSTDADSTAVWALCTGTVTRSFARVDRALVLRANRLTVPPLPVVLAIVVDFLDRDCRIRWDVTRQVVRSLVGFSLSDASSGPRALCVLPIPRRSVRRAGAARQRNCRVCRRGLLGGLPAASVGRLSFWLPCQPTDRPVI
jgi:hypothetical protein